jgi:hypothetical protein
LVIFAWEISGLRQLCRRFFLSPLIFMPRPQRQTHCSPSALSASKDRANKPFIFLFLQTPQKRGKCPQVLHNQSVADVLQEAGGGYFQQSKKKPETGKLSGVL